MKKIIITEKQLGKLVSEQTYVLGCEGFEMLDPSFQNTLCAQCEDPTYTNMHCDCCPSDNTSFENPINTETNTGATGDIDPSTYFDASMPGMDHPVRPQRKIKPKPRKRNR
tara:strand:+ start:80 stop:412 length:333 start_codon:yes stop_codon:yes gene_type:complete